MKMIKCYFSNSKTYGLGFELVGISIFLNSRKYTSKRITLH